MLSLWNATFARIQANDKVHLAWCVGGVIGCLVAYGVLQVTWRFKERGATLGGASEYEHPN